MLTFEKVLEVFQAYLMMILCMRWCRPATVICIDGMGTPPEMTGTAPRYRKLRRICGTLCWIHTPIFLEDKITGNDRDLTVTETGEIQQVKSEL